MDARTQRFEEYVSLIAEQLKHADRVEPFRGYCTGLLLPGERKKVEPMAARLRPRHVLSEHQRLHYFVSGRGADRRSPLLSQSIGEFFSLPTLLPSEFPEEPLFLEF